MSSELAGVLNSERLIALETRDIGSHEDPQWTSARRQQYLLRLDCARPLSADTLVWEAAPQGPGCWRIAITVIDNPESSEQHPSWDFPLSWPEPEPRTEFLGYDVGDAGLLSGLMNCGYDEEAAELRERFARHLNHHHLFYDRERALHFARLTNERVPEHAPFFVYGLYRLTDEK